MTNFSDHNDRRKQNRRIGDRINDDLYRALSSSNCHSCLENQGESVLLLNHERKILYITTSMQKKIHNCNDIFKLEPHFSLHDQQKNLLIQAYFNNHENRFTLNLKLSSPKKLLFLTCIRLPNSSFLHPTIAHYIIKLRDGTQYSDQQWHDLGIQFSLTRAEIKLCRALMDGLVLKENQPISVYQLQLCAHN